MSRSILFTFLIFCQLVFLPILLLLLLQFLLLSGSWLPFACFATSHPNKFCPNSFSLYRPAPSFFFVPAPAHFNQTTVLLTAPHSAPACSFNYSNKAVWPNKSFSFPLEQAASTQLDLFSYCMGVSYFKLAIFTRGTGSDMLDLYGPTSLTARLVFNQHLLPASEFE